MRLLLDTHVFLWSTFAPERLGRSRDLLADPGNRLLLSAASAWEIAIKYALGRLDLPEPPQAWVPSSARLLGAESASVDHATALDVGTLPPHHGDPFDRLLVAHSRSLGAPLVTAGRIFRRYDVELIEV